MSGIKLLATSFMITLSSYLSAQIVFYQDVFHGGVTAGGFCTGQGVGSGVVSLHIEPGSTIRKAYLFSYTERYPPITPISVNGIPYTFDTILNRIMKVTYPSIYASPISLYVKDITTDLITSPTNIFNITIPLQLGLPINAGWYTAFLYIEYENASLPTTSTTIIINNQNLIGNEIYSINNLNSINTLYPVGFSLFTDRTGAFFAPDERVYFNTNLLGIIGGSDNVNNTWNYAGVKGHFYFQNNELFGLDDDTPDAFMNGTDGLADVSPYLSNNATSFNFKLSNIQYPNQNQNKTNINLAYFLTYTTP